MLLPLLAMALGFTFYFAALLMVRVRSGVLERERRRALGDEVGRWNNGLKLILRCPLTVRRQPGFVQGMTVSLAAPGAKTFDEESFQIMDLMEIS